MQSFAYKVKSELCRAPVQRLCCARAEAYGVLLFCNTFTPREVRIITENPEFAARLPRLFSRAFSLKFDRLPEDDGSHGKLVFQITDRAKLERMIASVDSIAPDYLLFGGDLADVSTMQLDEWGYASLFRQLTSKAKIAAVAINGNHESMQEGGGSDPDAWMRKVGFVVLDDSSACIGQACFTGRTDFQVARSRGIERVPLASLVPNDSVRPWILMDHQPKGIEPEYSGRLPDFALSGHTHDGQFFPGTIVINFVWRLAFGEGMLDGVRWLVSAGVDCWGPPVRAGSDADMWVIRFTFAE